MANFPPRPRKPIFEIPFPPSIQIILNGKEDLRVAGVVAHSRSPEDHAKYMQWEKDQAKRKKYYLKELEHLNHKIDQPPSKFKDEYLWRRLIDIMVELEWWDLNRDLEADVTNTAKKLSLRHFQNERRVLID